MAIFTQTVKRFLPGPGFANLAPSSTQTAWQKTGVALSTASSPVTSTLTLPGPISGGYIHVRAYNVGGAAATTFSFQVTGTDGTSVAILVAPTAAVGPGATGANEEVNLVYLFLTELVLTSVSVIVTVATAGGTGTLDWEILGN